MARRANLDELARREREMTAAAMRRILLWIAIGNGAGLAAMGSKLIDNAAAPLALVLLPACWLFASGLVLSGVTAALEAHRFRRSAWKLDMELEGLTPPKDRFPQLVHRINDWTEGAAGVCFVAGLVYPIATVSNRFLQTGSLLG